MCIIIPAEKLLAICYGNENLWRVQYIFNKPFYNKEIRDKLWEGKCNINQTVVEVKLMKISDNYF